MFFALLIVVGLVIAAYFYLTWNFEYWKSRGVISPKPRILFGNFSNSFTRKCHMNDELTRIYNDYKNRANFVGIYQMRSPRVLILEPELVKEILIKNFKSFHENEFSQMFDVNNDPLFARNPFLSRGEEWKERRNEISPAFSSNRIKALYPLIHNVCDRLTNFIRENMNQPFEAKELATKFTAEAVTNCVFGIEANCLSNEDSELRNMSKQLSSPSGLTILKVLLVSAFPFLKSFLKIQFIPNNVNNFFFDLLDQAIDYRTKHKIAREDYLDYLIKLQNKKGLSNRELAGHSTTFFSDGLETSSISIAFTLYELARNVDVQEKLRKEINKAPKESGKLSYDTICELPYLDQVMNESLRLHSPFPSISKECTETTEIEYTKGKSVVIEKGINVYLPLYQLQRDAEYYPRPNEFIPERFDPEHGGVKAFKDMGVFLTFGDGPRACIGMKFAVMQSKAAIVEIIKNFKVTVNEKTEPGFVIDAEQFMYIKKGGLWIDFKPVKTFQL